MHRILMKGSRNVFLLSISAVLPTGIGCALFPESGAVHGNRAGQIELVAARVHHPEHPEKQPAAGDGTAGPASAVSAAEEASKPPLAAAPTNPPSRKMADHTESPPAASPPSAYRLRAGNPVRIDLMGIPDARVINDVIDETGMINLMYIGEIIAAGKTAHELERDIEKAYVQGKFYRHISVNVVVQAKQYFVRGEVQRPGSFPLTAGATLSQAIAVSGGFSEFANLKKIRISRGGKTTTVNFKDIEKDSRMDIPLEVGDTIVVTRSVF